MNDAKARVAAAEARLAERFAAFDAVERENTERVLAAFSEERVATRHFAGSTGYGYGDEGRDTLERVYARVFGAQAALVRPGLVSGTHALATGLFGALRPGDALLSATGKPYDTLEQVIGITPCDGSLADYGVSYRQAQMRDTGIDVDAVLEKMDEHVALITIQRSCGYALRPSLTVEQIGEAIARIRAVWPKARFMVDNCYGEFLETREPTHVGANLMAGSLIKNPGGGLAPTGGYLAGDRDLIERCACRLTSPGIGAEVGSYEGGYRLFYQGFFLAPHTALQAARGALLFAKTFEALGMRVHPASDAPRSDIIQAIVLEDPEKLLAFMKCVQAASPVEGYVTPEPWEMPGYADPVIMAAGTFVGGASIELSADGPMRPPYTAYVQGGLTYIHARLALERILEAL